MPSSLFRASSEALFVFPPRKREDIDLPTGLLLGCAILAAWLSWNLPNHYPPWISFHGELAMAIAGASTGAWVLWRSRANLIRMPWIAAFAFLAAIVPLVQLAAGLVQFAGDAILPATYLLAFGLACWFGHSTAAGLGYSRSLEPVWLVLVAGAFTASWLALYQWQGLDYLSYAAIDIAPRGRPFGNLIQPNQLATLLVLGGVGVGALFVTSRIGGFAACFSMGLLTLALALTQSRAGLLEVVVVGVVCLGRRRLLASRLRTGHVLMAVASVLGICILWTAFGQIGDAVPLQRDLGDMGRAGARPLHWLTLLDALGRQPWSGFGWNQVNLAQYAVALDHPASHETLGHSHNLLLDLLIYNGIPLGLAWIVALVLWMGRSFQRVASAPELLGLCAVAAVLTHALVEFPLHYAYFLLPTGFVMGAVSHAARSGPVLPAPRWLAPVLLAVAVGAGVTITADYMQIEARVRQLRFEVARVGLDRPPLTPWSSRALTQLEHFWNYAIQREHGSMTSEELSEAEAVVRRFPSKENLFRLAAAYAINGRGSEAPAQLERICRMNPPSSCEWAQEIWAIKGMQDPGIAAVAWRKARR